MICSPGPGERPLDFGESSWAPSSLDDLPRVQDVLGSWRKVKTLGCAQFGKVLLIAPAAPDQHMLPQALALKVMPRSAVLEGGGGPESASNELRAALFFRQQTPQLANIAKVYFVAQDDNFFYLATEYCMHGELLLLVQKSTRFLDAVLREVMAQVFTGVQALHRQGIAHRDISLENIVVTESGKVRLIDFGQAVRVHEPLMDDERQVPPSAVGPTGKAPYRAPELRGPELQPYSAKRADMFAVGVLLYALAFGAYPPMELCTERPHAESYCFVRGIVHAQGAFGHASPQLLDLLCRLLAYRPHSRPTAAEALAHPWMSGADLCPRPPPAADKTEIAKEAPQRDAQKQQRRRKFQPRQEQVIRQRPPQTSVVEPSAQIEVAACE